MKLIDQIPHLRFPAELPKKLLVVEQRFERPVVENIPGAVSAAMDHAGLADRVAPGKRVAVGVGSRGISNLPVIVRSVVNWIKTRGATPFLFPAMGSHGGATAEGQLEMLAGLGVTEASCAAPLVSSMDVVEIGKLDAGPSLYMDANAARADATIVIGRIRPHTDFHASIESGLAKMSVIGLGKRSGAEAMHAFGAAGFRQFLPLAPAVYSRNTNLIGGLGIIENAYGETALVTALPIREFGGPVEAGLLNRARELMPSLPFEKISLLVVKEMGKNYSGTGMDTNVLGRLMIPREPEFPGGPDIMIVAVLDLSEETHGNAAGCGLANVTTRRLAQKVDWTAVYTNSIVTGPFGMLRAALPITMQTDLRALEVAVRGTGLPHSLVDMVFIRNTKQLDMLWVSPNLEPAVRQHPRLKVVGEVPLEFDDNETILSPWKLSEF